MCKRGDIGKRDTYVLYLGINRWRAWGVCKVRLHSQLFAILSETGYSVCGKEKRKVRCVRALSTSSRVDGGRRGGGVR